MCVCGTPRGRGARARVLTTRVAAAVGPVGARGRRPARGNLCAVSGQPARGVRCPWRACPSLVLPRLTCHCGARGPPFPSPVTTEGDAPVRTQTKARAPKRSAPEPEAEAEAEAVAVPPTDESTQKKKKKKKSNVSEPAAAEDANDDDEADLAPSVRAVTAKAAPTAKPAPALAPKPAPEPAPAPKAPTSAATVTKERFQRVRPDEVTFAKDELKDNSFLAKVGRHSPSPPCTHGMPGLG
jgi:hypothetical protein